MKRLLNILAALSVVSTFVVSPCDADEKLSPEQTKFFETKIRPVLARECYSCHSTQVGQVKGGLWLDTQDGMLTGGDSGPAIVPNNLDESLLWSAINHEDFSMPPRKHLSDAILADFRQWIEMGAPDPRVQPATTVKSSITSEDIAAGKQFWSFKRPEKQSVPQSDSDWPVTDIDQYVFEKLNAQQLQPNPDAAPQTLLRRLTFDLNGLPPTPQQLSQFLQAWEEDPTSAIESAVDALLEKPQFGERWGRHWLDVARYAESTGQESNMTYPQAWRYRDYVIDSFNEDKPYNEFLQQQVAGDLLPTKSEQQWSENLVATGFLAIGPKSLIERNKRQFELDLIDEQIDVTTRVMLGVSVACARCHDHKFDPIPQSDYYAMSGIFRSMTTHYGTVQSRRNYRWTNLLILPTDDLNPSDKKISTAELKKLSTLVEDQRKELAEVERAAQIARRSGDVTEASQRKYNQQRFRLQAAVGLLDAKVSAYDESGNPLTYCMGVQATEQPINARLLDRGEFDKPGQVVDRGFPQVLCDDRVQFAADSSGRLELARWIGSENNPLTARVMVNRVWLHLFGNGIVRSPENFGATGQRPTHPELLDYLAIRFMEQGWSVKQLIREIVLTRTYRTSSEFNSDSFEIDPDNKFLWRVEAQRLEAEALRDAMLAISGQLDTVRPRASLIGLSGPGSVQDGLLAVSQALGDNESSNMMDRPRGRRMMAQGMQANSDLQSLRPIRKPIDVPLEIRSVYLPIVRESLPRSLDVFDFAEPSLVVGQRDVSNTPDQGLYFLNNEFVIEQSDAMARRLIKESTKIKDQIESAFTLAYGRQPSSREVRLATHFYKTFKVNSSSRRGGPEHQKLSAVCQGILAAAEFRTVD